MGGWSWVPGWIGIANIGDEGKAEGAAALLIQQRARLGFALSRPAEPRPWGARIRGWKEAEGNRLAADLAELESDSS